MPRLPGVTTVWLFLALSATGLATAQGPGRPRRPAPKPSGSGGVKVMASEADPNALAVAAAPALTQAAADFRAQQKALAVAEGGAGGPAYSAEDVGKLLVAAEGAVRKALGEPELTPLRDRAALMFHHARATLGAGGGGGQIEKGAAEGALEPVGQFLEKLAALAGKGPVTTDLCVVSKPEPGARFSIRPAGDPAAVKTLPATDGPLTAVRGLYAYRLEPVPGGKAKAIECGWSAAGGTGDRAGGKGADACLDLFDDARTPLVCDFAQGACARAAGTCP